MDYFSDRERGPAPRTVEEVTPEAWAGIWALISARLSDSSFGHSFPEQCRESNGISGYDSTLFEGTAAGHGIIWPITKNDVPDTLDVMDILEFVANHLAKPIPLDYHSYWRHTHLDFDVEKGKAEFRASLNRILARTGLSFEMDDNGVMRRLAPPELTKVLKNATFATGDKILDELLEHARKKFMAPNLKVRKEALEKIWDAFERLKTLENAKDKKASIAALLQKALPDADLRKRVNEDMAELTEIGNTYMIRHTEIGKRPITKSEHVDYFFQRMFAVVRLLLKGTARGG